jgi:hypothetical protein
MTLEEAAKKAFEKTYEGITEYKIDGRFVDLNCKTKAGNAYTARIIFDNTGTHYHAESPHEDLESITDFAEEVKKNLELG